MGFCNGTNRLLGKIMAHVWIPNFSNRLVLSPIERKVQVVGMARLMSESHEVRGLERLERRVGWRDRRRSTIRDRCSLR